MIYIYFPFYKPVYSIHTFTIPFHYFIDSIYRTLKENSYEVKMLTNKKDLYKNKLDSSDFFICFSFSFGNPRVWGDPSLGNKPDFMYNYTKNTTKQVIIIHTEEINCRPQILDLASEEFVHSIWDFSEKNKRVFKFKNMKCFHVPIGYHPCVKWNKKSQEKDIDFFFYGSMGGKRDKMINDLKQKGYNVVFKNCYEDEFIDKVMRTKIILIIHRMDDEKCVDFYRLSCLLTNNVFVIHESVDDEYIETQKKFDKIIYCPYDSMVDKAEYYLKMSQKERDDISNEISKWWVDNHHIKNYIPFEIFK